jgi:hypothetical protein
MLFRRDKEMGEGDMIPVKPAKPPASDGLRSEAIPVKPAKDGLRDDGCELNA